MKNIGAGMLIAFLLVGCSKETHNFDDGRYIVVYKRADFTGQENKLAAEQATAEVSAQIEQEHSLGLSHKTFSTVISAGVYDLTKDQALALYSDPRVDYLEKDQIVRINAVQSGATWGLDRIDQVSLPLNQSYNSPAAGVAPNVYVIDTGIKLTHQEFQGRARSGADIVDNDGDATDCNGHGTHVAGTIGGATYGVAKNANLFAVRVLDCQGSGSISDVVAGVEWVTKNHIKPAVVNMSLGGGASKALDDAISASIEAGVTYVVAAGNENALACNGSPSRVRRALTVAASSRDDARASFSNYGDCVDLFAPGVDITSAWYNSNTATNTISGTSMASPHVAGVAALYLSLHPQALPDEVAQKVVAGATSGKISKVPSATPNLLLNTLFLSAPPDNGGGGGDNGGGGDDNPDKSLLQNNQVVEGLAGAKSEEKYYKVIIPAGSAKFSVEMSGTKGDADLYVKKDTVPTVSSYSCRPYASSSKETCNFTKPAAGTWHIMIRGYAAYSDVKLKVSY